MERFTKIFTIFQYLLASFYEIYRRRYLPRSMAAIARMFQPTETAGPAATKILVIQTISESFLASPL